MDCHVCEPTQPRRDAISAASLVVAATNHKSTTQQSATSGFLVQDACRPSGAMQVCTMRRLVIKREAARSPGMTFALSEMGWGFPIALVPDPAASATET